MKSGSHFAFATFISLINVWVKVRIKLGLGFRIGYICIFFFTKTIVAEAPVLFVKPKFLRLCGDKIKVQERWFRPLSFLALSGECRYVTQ